MFIQYTREPMLRTASSVELETSPQTSRVFSNTTTAVSHASLTAQCRAGRLFLIQLGDARTWG